MGLRGPAPTPTALLELRGSKELYNRKAEPKPSAEKPVKPKWLTKDDAKVWRQVTDELARMGTLARSDGNAIGRYCSLVVEWATARAFVNKLGQSFIVRDSQGKVKEVRLYPQVAVIVKMNAALLALEREFGLTPASRARIQVNVPERKTDSIKEKFLAAMRN